MSLIPRVLSVVLGIAVFFSALAAVAADDGPLSLDDIRQLRREKVAFKKITENIEERGLSFDVDDDAAKSLRRIGFSAKQVADLKDKYGPADSKTASDGGNKPAARPVVGKGRDKKADNGAGKPVLKAKGKPRVLDPQTEADYKALEQRVDKIAKESGVPVKPHKAKHSTLIANPRIASIYVPDVEKLEKMIAERFPEPLATGVDLRANNIALLETRYEYESWMKALLKVFKDDGYNFNGHDPLPALLKTNGSFVNGIFSVCLEGQSVEDGRRAVAFGVGYQYFRQLTGKKTPHALQTGFGNLTEAMMMREPWTTVLSGYVDRKLEGGPIRWGDLVRQRFARNEAGSAEEVLRYSTENMTLPKYAEAWSFTSLLAGDPHSFAELVTKLGQDGPAPEAIQAIYGVSAQQVDKEWKKAVLGSR